MHPKSTHGGRHARVLVGMVGVLACLAVLQMQPNLAPHHLLAGLDGDAVEPIELWGVAPPHRGIAIRGNYLLGRALDHLGKGVRWGYNWGTGYRHGTENELGPDGAAWRNSGIQFVPMVSSSAALQARMGLIGSKYVMGFQEPNTMGWSQMAPQDAAAVWPDFLKFAFGRQSVSPAVVFSKGVSSAIEWLDAFGCGLQGLPHYVAAHYYEDDDRCECDDMTTANRNASCQASGLKDALKQLERYGRPVWLTAFARKGGNVCQQTRFMKAALCALHKDPELKHVERYAWMGMVEPAQPVYTDQLLDARGELTPLGKTYVNFNADWECTNDGNVRRGLSCAQVQECAATPLR